METHEIGPIRPPSEARSLLLRLTRNCPWNRCEFCPLYKGAAFSRRTVADVKADIDLAAQSGGGEYKTAFLQDADSILFQTDALVEILSHLKEKLPGITRVTMYARAATLERKSLDELRRLRAAGLARMHVGLESGYNPLLEYVKKGLTSEEAVDAGRKVMEAGISLSEYVLLGLGGKRWSREHAEATADVLNQINPDYIRIRTLSVHENTPLWSKVQSGAFQRLSDEEVVREERVFIDRLAGISGYVASDHSLNLLMQIKGQLPDAKADMLNVIDRYLALPEREKRLFELGRRMHAFHALGDLSDEARRARVDEALRQIESDSSVNFAQVIWQLMGRLI